MPIKKAYLRVVNASWRTLSYITLGLIVFSTIALPIIEPETFKSYVDSLYFTTTTIPTIGYGDIAPQTIIGKIYTIVFLQLFGVGLFTAFITKSIDSFIIYRRKKEHGEIMYEGKNHMVIMDWSHKTENAIEEILSRDPKEHIVVIDTLDQLPIVHKQIHYVRGYPTNTETLTKANVKHAKSVFIFSDDRIKDQLLRDGKTLLIACAVERIAPNTHTAIEVEREEHIDSFKHINIDKFILSNDTIAKRVVDSLYQER